MKKDNDFFVLRRRHYNAIRVVGELRRFLRSTFEKDDLVAFIKKEFFDYFAPHLINEEMILFPQLPPDNKLRVTKEEQHTSLHSLAECCVSADKISAETVEALANLLEENVRFEERILFPYLEKLVNNEYWN